MNGATVVRITHPFHPWQGREVEALPAGRTIRALAPAWRQPFICLRNGAPLLRADWDQTVRDGDIIAFVSLPQGGGPGGSNPLRVLLMVAVMTVAPYVGAYAGLMTSSMTVYRAVTAITAIGGMALVNTLLPPPQPPRPQQLAELASPSPTYSLTAQGNRARIGQPIPVIYGRHIVFPDFAAQPYTEFAGNEQYLYQLFVIGQGEYAIEAIRIDDTPVANFAEITTEIVPPGGALTLFPANVVTSTEVSGQEAAYNVTLGPFAATAPSVNADQIAIDVAAPAGLFYANDDGTLGAKSVSFRVEARPIDDAGAPLGAWTTLGNETITAATNTPQRRSYRYGVAPGRYEVRLTRTDPKDTSSRAGHTLTWTGLRAYLTDATDYGDVTLLAMRARATNNLSAQASRRVNCIVTRKLPTWSAAGGWSAPVATRSIAWAAADILRAAYGANLPDAQIDLAALEALEATWSSRGDTFNGVFDSRQTVWDALTQVLKAGRAAPFIQGGVVRFVRDEPQSLPVALFSPRNIVANSLSVQYLMPADDQADAVEVEYFDETVWKPRTVLATLPNGSAAKPARIRLFGVTNRDQAWREAMYLAAANKYRRLHLTFRTEMEGFIPSPGDLIAIQHDQPEWGQGGEVIDVYQAGYFISGETNPAASGKTGGVYITVPQDPAETVFGGRTIVVEVLARAFEGNPTAEFALAYSTNDVGNSGWRRFAPTTDWAWYSFTYAVPAPNAGGADFLGLWADTSGGWRGLLVAAVRIRLQTTPAEQAEFSVRGDDPGWTITGSNAYALNNTLLVVDQPPAWSPGLDHVIGLRRRDGSLNGPLNVRQGPAANEIECLDAPDFTPYTGQREERTHFAFGITDQAYRLARVIPPIRPQGEHLVEITAVAENDSVHTADQGVPPAPSVWQLPRPPGLGDVVGLSVRLSGTSRAPLFIVEWQPVPGAEHYIVERSTDNGVTWARLGAPLASEFHFPAEPGVLNIRVAAVSLTGRGPWAQWTGQPFLVPPPDVGTFLVEVASDGTRVFRFGMAVTPPDLAGYRIRYGPVGSTWETMTPLHDGLLLASPWETNQLDAGTYAFAIVAVDTSGVESVNPVYITSDLPNPRQSAGVLVQALPHAEGWPGTRTGCHLGEDGALYADDQANWATLPADWSGWTDWAANPVSPITYEHPPIDLGGPTPFSAAVSANVDGTPNYEVATSDDGATWTAWAAPTGQIVTARYLKARVTVSGAHPVIRQMTVQARGPSVVDDLVDIDPATLSATYRLGVGDYRLPITKSFSVIRQITLALQGVTGGNWTWTIVDKQTSPGPRGQIFNNGTPADPPAFDALVRGA